MIDGLSAPLMLMLMMGGLSLLALSQDQHRRSVGVAPLKGRARAPQRLTGYVLIGVALPLAIRHAGAGFGTLLWAVLLSVAAHAVTAVLAWKPQWLAPLAHWSRP